MAVVTAGAHGREQGGGDALPTIDARGGRRPSMLSLRVPFTLPDTKPNPKA
jgi:hypothetical protein